MIFDCHVHLPSPGLAYTWEWQPHTPDVSTAVEYLRHCKVDRILANSVRGEIATTAEEMVAANTEIAQIAAEYPGFIVPACLVNPNFHHETLEELNRCHEELGMIWVGELCGYAGNYTYDTPAFADMVHHATQLGMIVNFHEDDYREVDRICAAFPDATLVLSHLADTEEDTVNRIGLAARYPNLYLDICGNGYERMGVLEHAVRMAGADRILFGSDFTINDPASVIARVERSRFDEATRQKILGGNLLRLLRERGLEG